MRIGIHAIGRMKKGPELELLTRYQQRALKAGPNLGFQLISTQEWPESRASTPDARKVEEAEKLCQSIGPQDIIIALDERGKSLSSEVFAKKIATWRDDGCSAIYFILGGPDGLAPEIRAKATLTLSFGTATWPHQFARIMLSEQIYRAMTILSGHPYHRI